MLLMLLMATNILSAQNVEKKNELENGWTNSLVAGLNVTQVSLHNWTQGGENTLAWTFLSNGLFAYKQDDWTWMNLLKITYGQTKIGESEYEKADDEIFWESIYSRNIGWPVDPYIANQLRTQMAPGYKMVMDEESDVAVRTQTSGFFDPGYLIQSIGFKYSPSDAFFTRAGVAFKETFSSSYGFADDKDTPDEVESFMFQTGIESATGVKFRIMENMLLTSQLNLFSAFDKLDVWDVRWDNTINAKVNDYVTVALNVLLVHEIAQTRRTQVKQVLALGLRYSLL